MDAKSKLKLDIISNLEMKIISLIDAMTALNVSKRTIYRYLKEFNKKGSRFVVHGNLGKVPANKIKASIEESVTQLMKEKYYDFNVTHAIEKLSTVEGISVNRETFRKICHKIGLVKKGRQRRAKTRKVRDRIAQAGVMLQMDGSPHRWFGDRQSCLIGAIDDATSEVYWAEFFESETTIGCMRVLKKIIETKGLFKFLYTDRAGIFGGQKRVEFSQLKRALKELGIHIIFASSPQAKGRIERLWSTLQDRLIPEMRIRHIRSFEAANHFLQEQYLNNEHNKKFSVIPANLEPAWRPLPASVDLQEVFCIKERRLVKPDHTFSWNGLIYKITSDFKYSIKKQKIELRVYLDESWKVYFADKEISVQQHHYQPKISVVENVTITEDQEDIITVRKDSHIEYLKKFYSVDPKYIGQCVSVSEQDNMILVYKKKTLIESHKKITSNLINASTKSNHLEPWQETLRPGSVYRSAAQRIGPYCDKIIFAILQRGQGVVDNKSIWGIIGYEKTYSRASVEEACKIAYELGSCDYRTVSSTLRLRFKKRAVGA